MKSVSYVAHPSSPLGNWGIENLAQSGKGGVFRIRSLMHGKPLAFPVYLKTAVLEGYSWENVQRQCSSIGHRSQKRLLYQPAKAAEFRERPNHDTRGMATHRKAAPLLDVAFLLIRPHEVLSLFAHLPLGIA